MSNTTVGRRLRSVGLHSRVARRKPFINETNRVKRLQFAKNHQHWKTKDWAKVLWSDETKFEFFALRKQVRVRRRKGEAFKKNCLQGTVKHGGGSLMVWGAMASGGVGTLVKIDYILTGATYKQILVENLKSSFETALDDPGNDYFFQQDNDPKHTSKVIRNFIVDEGTYRCWNGLHNHLT